MNKKERDFLNDNFKAGEYHSLSLMVKEEQINIFLTKLKTFGLTLAIIPSTHNDEYQLFYIFVKNDEMESFKEKMKQQFNININKKIIKQ